MFDEIVHEKQDFERKALGQRLLTLAATGK